MKKVIDLFLVVIILLAPQQLFAKYKTEFIPSISVGETYDDNIYLENTNEKSDWITSINPGISLNIYSQKNNFSLNYLPSIVRYKSEDNLNNVRQSGDFNFTGELSENLQFDMSDAYIQSEDPLEDPEGLADNRETRNKYKRNNWDTSINYIFGPSNSFLLGVAHSWLDNEDPTRNNGKIIDPYAEYSYWFNQKHGIDLNLGYTDANFSRNDGGIPEDDYSGGRAGAGYNYRVNQHTVASWEYDYSYRNFTGQMNEEDYRVHESSVGFEKELSEDLSYNISVGYFIQDPEYSEGISGMVFDINLEKDIERGSFTIGANGGWDGLYLVSDPRGFTKYQQFESTFDYNVLKYLVNYASIRYRHDKDQTSRKSKTIRIGYGWRWLISRYFSASIDYSRATRDDDLDSADYKDNRVILIIKWQPPNR